MSNHFIPYGRQLIENDDIEAVVDALSSDFLTQGPRIAEFEDMLASYVGAKYSVAVNSATSALHIACLALGLGDGDYLWTSPNTFVASANVGRLCGANVDFVDIDSKTYNMCPEKLELKLIKAKEIGKLPKIVIPVHFAGQSCDMEQIYSLSKIYDFKIIEDASHAVGATYKDSNVGSCRFSDITVFSFHPVKIITTAEGGVATTNSEEVFDRMSLFRSHGVTREEKFLEENHGPWYYQQIDLGLNYRMTDLQAALGISQMRKLDSLVLKRKELASKYNDLLKDLPVILPFQEEFSKSSLHLYPIKVKANKRKEVFEYLRSKNIGVNVHYIPVHTQPYYRKLGFEEGMFPESESYYAGAISLPLHPQLTDEEMNFVVQCLKESLR